MSRSFAMSRAGGSPKCRRYSRLNCEALSQPTLKAAVVASMSFYEHWAEELEAIADAAKVDTRGWWEREM